MPSHDHWHPVLLSSALHDRPVGVRLDGKEIALFRSGPGQIGALDECCPHRRMRLSKGTVVQGHLQCRYHGWKFDCSGQGESPGTPKLHACTAAYETLEKHGAIWLRAQGAQTEFPRFDIEGHYQVCTLQHQVKAPLEVMLDNFTEIEHTPTTHAFFGYPLERMHEVDVQIDARDDAVLVSNRGPSKPVPWHLRLLLGIGADWEFRDDWVTRFSPVHSVYDHWWQDPHSDREGRVRWRLYLFFTPLDAETSSVTTFAFTKSTYPGPAGAVRLFKWLMIRMLDREIRLDVDILENLLDKDPRIEGMKLSRFDKVLGLHRDRIDRVYRGLDPRTGTIPFRAGPRKAA